VHLLEDAMVHLRVVGRSGREQHAVIAHATSVSRAAAASIRSIQPPFEAAVVLGLQS
jgi:hypothetical protein